MTSHTKLVQAKIWEQELVKKNTFFAVIYGGGGVGGECPI